MAEAVLTTLGGAALQVLFKEVINYYKRREGGDRRPVEQRVSSLRTHLMNLQIPPINAEAEWLAEVRTIAYDAEDALDAFATGVLKGEVRPRSKVRTFISYFFLKRKISNVWNTLERVARERNILRTMAEGIQEDRPVEGDNSSGAPPIGSGSLPTEPILLGRDGDMAGILGWLLPAAVVHAAAEEVGDLQAGPAGEENSNYSVRVIEGMAGVGKTALAQHIYNNQRVKDSFKVRAWVYAGNKFEEKGAIWFIQQILESTEVEGSLADLTNLDRLQRMLENRVEGRQFLLVLDDVWGVDQTVWKTLQAPLRSCSKGSRVLVTSHRKEIAKIMTTEPPFVLSGLPFDSFWPLFKKCAFGSEPSGATPTLEGIAMQIACKLCECELPLRAGLPLAAVTLGSHLKLSGLDEKKWSKILVSELWDVKQILPSLRISYKHLPHHLKRCLLYCSILPKGDIFKGTTLVQLWMAQGFLLQSDEDRSLEEIGRDYLDELVSRSFFQPTGDDTYSIHGLIHDLAREIFKNHCMWAEKRITSSSSSQSGAQDVLHVSYYFDDRFWDKLESCRYKKLRTLLSLDNPNCGESSPQAHVPLALLGSWRCLRVLNLFLCLIETLPDSIGSLVHLRYLDISFTTVRQLPKALTRIFNLQTLKLVGNPELKHLPRDMNMLVNLRHLEADSELVSGITAIGKLRLLQKLEGFRVGRERGHTIAELGAMAELRVLSVCCLDNVESEREAREAKLEDKRHLRSLELEWGDDGDASNLRTEDRVLEGLRPHSNLKHLAVARYDGIHFPSWIEDGHLQHLKTLHLKQCGGWEALPSSVSKLPSLASLTIEQMSGMRTMGAPGSAAGGGGGGGSDVNFPWLETLEMRKMPVLEAWHGIEQCQWFPRLRVLKITNCPMLQRLPPLPLELTELSLCTVGLNALPEFWLNSINGDAGVNRRNSSLLSLTISYCPNLVSLGEGLMASRRLVDLQQLKIDHCEELKVPPVGTSADFASLESVTIELCPKLLLPGRVPLPSSLKHVRITPCSAALTDSVLRRVSNMAGLRELRLAHDSTEVHFTHELFHIKGCGGLESTVLRSCLSLRGMSSILELEIHNCPSLISISGEALRGLTALRRLMISGCTGLVSMGIPALAHLKALTIEDCPEFMLLTSDVPSSSSSTTGHPGDEGLHSLTELCITACPKIRSLGDEVLRRMPTLSKVEITDCADLVSVRLHFLTSLRALEITGCPNLTVPNRTVMPGNQSKLLPLESLSVEGAEVLTSCLLLSDPTSLRELWITKCPQLASFGSEPDEALKCLTSLQQLTFARCSDMRCLPSQLHSLRSLEELQIWDCPMVESLPETGLPPSLRSLSILGCPALATRCRTVGDPNWSRIARVQTRQIMEGWP